MKLRKERKSYHKRDNKVRVKEIWSVSKECYWCGKETKLATPKNEGEQFHDTATFDHLYSRLDKRRFTSWGDSAGVLACYECNHKRGAYEWFQELTLLKRLIIVLKLHKRFKAIKKFLYGKQRNKNK